MPHAALTWFVCLLAAPWVGCDAGVPGDPPSPVATPARRFAAQGLRITEMRDGRVLWRGTVARAEGDDLETTTVEQISLRREPTREGESALTIEAPRGELRLADGHARFEQVRIRDGDGGLEVTAVSARYSEAAGQIVADGPIVLRAPGLRAQALSGVFHLGEDRLDLAGPVRGRWQNVAPQLKSP